MPYRLVLSFMSILANAYHSTQSYAALTAGGRPMDALVNRRTALTMVAATGVSCAAGGAFATTNRGGTTVPDSVRELCERYYTAWQNKKLDGILACLHPDVVFKSPNAATHGREAYASAARR